MPMKKNLVFIVFMLFSLSAAHAQPVKEEYYHETFYEEFDGPLDDQIWQVLTGSEHGGKLSRDRCFVENGLLNLVFIHDPGKGYLSSAIQTRNEFLYGKWEVRLKPSAVPGVLNSFYTIDWNNTSDEASGSDGTKQETDIEFLTRSFTQNTGEVHFAVHESGKKSFDTNPDIRLDFNPSSDFHVWGFEITPGYIQWFVDDTVLQRYVYSENEIQIDAPYALKMNFWSAESWIGGPPEPNVKCIYQIDWIRFTPYKN